jgi:hypothetical protein
MKNFYYKRNIKKGIEEYFNLYSEGSINDIYNFLLTKKFVRLQNLKSPQNNINSLIIGDIKKNKNSKFIKVGKGKYSRKQ